MELKDVRILGPRVLVEPEEPEDLEAKRAALAGIVVVRQTSTKPRPTVGCVVLLGNDPLVGDMGLVPGLRLSFASTAGDRQFVEGKEYRLLELQEIKMILPPL